MPWKRVALLLLLVLLQAAAAEARARKNSSHSRARSGRRSHHHHERPRPAEAAAAFSAGQLLTPAGDAALAANAAADWPPPAPQHPRRQQHHALAPTHRGQHPSRRRHHQHHQQQQQQPAQAPPATLEHECPSCYQLEMRKSLRLEQIKDRVLTATGLIKPPNMTGVVISSNPDVQGIIEDMQSAVPMPSNEPISNQDEPDVKTEMLFFPVQPGNHYRPHPGNSPPPL